MATTLPSPAPSPELEFLKRLWGQGTEEEEGYRTGPPGYMGWRNSFLGISSGAPYTFKNTSSVKFHRPPSTIACAPKNHFVMEHLVRNKKTTFHCCSMAHPPSLTRSFPIPDAWLTLDTSYRLLFLQARETRNLGNSPLGFLFCTVCEHSFLL